MASEPVPRTIDPRVSAARARVAVYTRDHRPPEQIQTARAELAEASAEAAIRRIVDSWPPLTQAQRERLALLLNPGAGHGAG